MANTYATSSDARCFIARLNSLAHVPGWSEAATLGVQTIDLSCEELALRQNLIDLEQARHGLDASVDHDLAVATEADIASSQERLAQIEAQAGRYFLATGEVIERSAADVDAQHIGWWHDDRTTVITTPSGDRRQRPGIHPDAAIDSTATIDPAAHVEAGATIGAHARVGAHAHIGRDAVIGGNSNVQDGTWIGTNTEIGPHAWISHGATVNPHCAIGHHATVGAGSRVASGTQVEPYSRLGSGTTTSADAAPRPGRGVQIANAVENLMRLDRD